MTKKTKDGERYMTQAEAKEFLNEVLTIVENELKGCCSVRTYQERMRGQVWGEGVTVDTCYEEGQGSFIDTRTICYHLCCLGGKAILRHECVEDYGMGTMTMPFYGSAKEAADYLLEEFRECFDDEDN